MKNIIPLVAILVMSTMSLPGLASLSFLSVTEMNEQGREPVFIPSSMIPGQGYCVCTKGAELGRIHVSQQQPDCTAHTEQCHLLDGSVAESTTGTLKLLTIEMGGNYEPVVPRVTTHDRWPEDLQLFENINFRVPFINNYQYDEGRQLMVVEFDNALARRTPPPEAFTVHGLPLMVSELRVEENKLLLLLAAAPESPNDFPGITYSPRYLYEEGYLTDLKGFPITPFFLNIGSSDTAPFNSNALPAAGQSISLVALNTSTADIPLTIEREKFVYPDTVMNILGNNCSRPLPDEGLETTYQFCEHSFNLGQEVVIRSTQPNLVIAPYRQCGFLIRYFDFQSYEQCQTSIMQNRATCTTGDTYSNAFCVGQFTPAPSNLGLNLNLECTSADLPSDLSFCTHLTHMGFATPLQMSANVTDECCTRGYRWTIRLNNNNRLSSNIVLCYKQEDDGSTRLGYAWHFKPNPDKSQQPRDTMEAPYEQISCYSFDAPPEGNGDTDTVAPTYFLPDGMIARPVSTATTTATTATTENESTENYPTDSSALSEVPISGLSTYLQSITTNSALPRQSRAYWWLMAAAGLHLMW